MLHRWVGEPAPAPSEAGGGSADGGELVLDDLAEHLDGLGTEERGAAHDEGRDAGDSDGPGLGGVGAHGLEEGRVVEVRLEGGEVRHPGGLRALDEDVAG